MKNDLYVCGMEIKTEQNEVIDVTRLHSITNYSKKIGISYNGVLVKIGSGKLRSTWISGMQYVIEDSNSQK